MATELRAVVLADAPTPARRHAEAVTDRARVAYADVRAGARRLVADLHEAWTIRADVELGFPSWHAYVESIVTDLHDVRLNGTPEAIVVRQALVASMTDDKMVVTEITARTGYSRGTVHADRVATGRAPAPRVGGEVVPLRPEPLPAPTGRVYQQAAEWLRRAAAGLIPDVTGGLTLVQLAAVAGWTEGKSSGALTYLRDRGLAARTDDRVDGQRVVVLTDVGAATIAA